MSARFFLYRRNGTYYFRWTVPLALRRKMPLGSPADVRVSLRTTQYALARQLAARYWLAAMESGHTLLVANFVIRYNDLLDAIRGRVRMAGVVDDEQLLTLGELLQTSDLSRLQDALAILHGAGAVFFIDLPPSEVTVWSRDYDEDGVLEDNIVEVLNDFADSEARVTRESITAALSATKNAFEVERVTSDQTGFWRGSPLSPDYYKIVLVDSLLCNISSLKVSNKWAARLPAIEAQPVTTPPSPLAAACDAISLSQARDTWIRDNSKSGGGKWSKSTTDNNDATVSQFIDIVGDKLTTLLTSNDFAMYEAVMRRLPTDWANTRRRTRLSFDEIALQGAAKPKVSPKTLKDKGAALGQFFRYLEKGGYWHGRYGGSLFATVKQKKSNNVRHSFSNSDLQAIYSGQGLPTFEQARYPLYVWGSILLLYTGARPAEVSQLKRHDVMQDPNGTWFLQFREEEDDDDLQGPIQSLKTEASFRAVPLHSDVIELGFLDFISRFKDNEWLFPEAFRHQQKVSREIGDWFNEKLLVKAGLKAKGVVLYSLRHTVINRFKHDATLAFFACAYTGHSTTADRTMSNSEFVNTYGKNFSPTELAEKLHPLLDFDINWEPMKSVIADKKWA